MARQAFRLRGVQGLILPLVAFLPTTCALGALPGHAGEMTYEQARARPDPGPLTPYPRRIALPQPAQVRFPEEPFPSPAPTVTAATPATAPSLESAPPAPAGSPTAAPTAPAPSLAGPTVPAAASAEAAGSIAAAGQSTTPASAASTTSARRLARLSGFPLVSAAATGAAPGTAAGSPAGSAAENYFLSPLRVNRRSNPKAYMVPSLAAGIPSGFVANSGQLYLGLFGSTSDRLRPEADGAMFVGLGLGDPAKNMAFEVDWNIGSMRSFNRNGSIDVKMGRYLFQDANNVFGFQIGLLSAGQYGPDQNVPTNYEGAVSWVTRLRPEGGEDDKLLMITVGAGGNRFGYGETGTEGVFAGAGVKVFPNLGISAAWSGKGANLMAAYVPFRDFPFQFVVGAGDIFNQTPSGAVGLLGFTIGRQVLPSF